MYGSINGATTYYESVGFSEWDLLDGKQQDVALKVGSMIVDSIYALRFPGQKAGGYQQVNQWPRVNAQTTRGEPIPDNVIPAPIELATYVIAREEILRPGKILPAKFDTQQVKKQKLDVLEREFFKNQSNDPLSHIPFLPLVEGILTDLLNSNGGYFPVFWVR